MKKNIITITCVIMLIPLLCACSKTSENVENEQTAVEETTVDAKGLIFASEDLGDAFAQFEGLMENAETTEEKEEIETYMNEYFLEDLNGFYYFFKPEKQSNAVSDSRTIYIKSKDEVYIIPYTEQELRDKNLELDDIPQIENSEIYRYHITDVSTKSSDSTNSYQAKVVFKSDYIGVNDEINILNSVYIACYADSNPLTYNAYGYFADLLNPDENWYNENKDSVIVGYSFRYCRDEDEAYALKAKRDEEDKDFGEPKKKAEPAIGMTKSEIENSSWGEPDKKNIDEYEWGTEEQWVYGNKGYIYFEDDKVTAIQHR